jgi:hypothetical protein
MSESSVSSSRAVRKTHLRVPQQQLVELMANMLFGRIESLQVSEGLPVFDPPPRVIRTVKVGGQNRPFHQPSDFVLKASVVELLAYMERMGDGIIERIEVANGLPLLMEVEQVMNT